MREITTSEEWKGHLEEQPSSGKTVKSYCHDNDLDLSSFYRQRRKFGTNNSGGEPQVFVQAPTVQPRKVSGSTLSIRVRDFHLALDPGYSAEDLEKVLFTLAKVRHVLCCE